MTTSAGVIDRTAPKGAASARWHSGHALALRVRLACGLVLLAYVALHLANHALGLVSLGAMEWGRRS